MKVISEINDKSQYNEEILSSIIYQFTNDIPVDIFENLPKKETLARTIRAFKQIIYVSIFLR